MRDELTAEERAAIAAYKGPVTVCPPRTFSEDPTHTKTWQEQKNETWAKKDKANRKRIAAANRRAKQKKEARIEQYRAMRAAGKGYQTIANEVGVSKGAVQKFCQRYGINAPEPGT